MSKSVPEHLVSEGHANTPGKVGGGGKEKSASEASRKILQLIAQKMIWFARNVKKRTNLTFGNRQVKS